MLASTRRMWRSLFGSSPGFAFCAVSQSFLVPAVALPRSSIRIFSCAMRSVSAAVFAIKKRLTSRQSQRHRLSRIVLLHAPRQPAAWLTCNVGQRKMSAETPPRNRFVLRRESGHPGYSNVVVLATPPDLLKLSEDVRKLAETGRGRVEHYVTEEKTPDSRGAVAFEVISNEELSALQAWTAKNRSFRVVGFGVVCVILALSAYGGYKLLDQFLGAATR